MDKSDYKIAEKGDVQLIFRLVQDTIRTVYPHYYPKEVVTFFRLLHSRERILEDILAGRAGVLLRDGQLLGTGSSQENHITRVYVHPGFQSRGYGTFILQQLEQKIFKTYDTVTLDASLPACCFYEHRGYRPVRHEKLRLENGAVLVYEIMEKRHHKQTIFSV